MDTFCRKMRFCFSTRCNRVINTMDEKMDTPAKMMAITEMVSARNHEEEEEVELEEDSAAICAAKATTTTA